MKSIKKYMTLILTLIILVTAFSSCTDDNTGSLNEISSGSVAESNDANTSTTNSQSGESENTSSEGSDHSHDSNVAFVLDVKAVPSESEAGVVNAVITLSHTHHELIAVQFHLAFSSSIVDGVYKTHEELKKIMTVVPTYNSTFGVPFPSFEQICLYNKASSIYECMFVDLLSYPDAEEGQEIDGIKSGEDFVITIPFKVNSDSKVGDKVTFELLEGTVSGTQAKAFSGVKGTGNSASYTLTEKDIVK